MAVPASEAMDFDSLVASIAKCDRVAVTNTVAAATTRHSDFLLASYKEQRAIAADRAALAERRRVLHAKEAKVDTEQGLTLISESLDDRTQALADQRALDQAEQDMMAYFRTQYLRQCSGKAS
ncbi:hypothetical protein AB5I39_04195 [Sphingomonas sp. MMS24-J45]|uniref:hypothetical protein n=1 Tax=Sphingomonas sp. MMS24-J45 TaxID=3238806 RepID=UPI00384A7936